MTPSIAWREQWTALREWIEAGDVLAHGARPTVLDGWSVLDLVAHLGRGFVTAGTAVETDEAPLTVRRYVTGYAGAAGQIETEARTLAAEHADRLLSWLDRVAEEAFDHVARLESPVVRGPRGPIRRDDFVVTRLLELVVHGDDLARSLPETPGSPLVPAAVRTVAASLADAYAEVAGRPPAVDAELEWIRVATGRVPATDPHLPLL